MNNTRLREIVRKGAVITLAGTAGSYPLDTADFLDDKTLFYKFAETDPYHWEHFETFDSVEDDDYQLTFRRGGDVVAVVGPAEEPEHIQLLQEWRAAGNAVEDLDEHIATLKRFNQAS